MQTKKHEKESFYAGYQFIDIENHANETPFPLLVMYPTHTEEKVKRLGPYTLNVTQGAPLSDGEFPLVIISHGDGSTPLVYRTISQFLARNGFIVGIPQHPFNNREDNSLSGTIDNLRNRPNHIRTVIDWFLKESCFSPSITPNTVSLIGHSMGGYTALAIAGGVPTSFPQESSDQKSYRLSVYQDKRIQSLILLAPATGWFREKRALENVNIPILMITGEKDTITPSFHSEFVLNGVPNVEKIQHKVVKNGGHFSFLSPFPDFMKSPEFPPSLDPGSFNRKEFHKNLQNDILNFLLDSL
ncbi:alpha/beta hydrolase family protein [Priestia filamentosa]|uniref:Alpha/beta hydrolase n=1 Tax=Priestia filamentosa TaxID=1402861 RepID=A0A1X7DYF9_9BACI|nr:alpha/beta hydrolase [Priestia filamentosa]AKO95021.2 alpha/beta hydrolase [Priestia filamentosa]MDT3762215.1 alpha/beta hydrolase [Priestia filamentosa]OXS68787.1 alpha/beta hydrolase [Priestia filamentosa]RJS64511.1 alpha/beta hydrolase [Priestia filamentosa]WRU96705.1 alpha/beta hydrolase [Priestia filamentosa]